ncbi:MAG: helix-hairpin-helix domain-containing protein [Phycisphaerales bacterium]|jgi:competence ComEA-like helix-hairpin-helix protein
MVNADQKMIQSFAFVIGMFAAFCFSLYFISESVGSGQVCEIKLESRINPNEAPIASLVRLPGIGISRAGAIVAYRESLGSKNEEYPAFRNSNDLQKVKGIGPKTVQKIGELLKFE